METIASYTLRSKDRALVHFYLQSEAEHEFGETQYKYQVEIADIVEENKHLLPYPLKNSLNNQKLLAWINQRKAPKNRQFVNQIMNAIEDSRNPLKYVDISHALSLNDAYWITNDDVPAKWQEFNLYDHPFDDVLAYVAFTGYHEKVNGVITSPELTSSGMLKKCWSNRKDGIFLLKGDDLIPRPDRRNQATMEFYAAQIAEKMEFEHVGYDLEEFHHRNGDKEIVCKCKLFTSENEGFINAYEFFLANGFDTKEANLSDLSSQAKMARLYGESAYQDLMVFDSLICNQDRHLGNFGYIVDNNTGKFLRPAPIFDNGFSLLSGASQNGLNNLEDYISTISGKYLDFDMQARLFIAPRHIPHIRSLLNFQFEKHPHFNVSDEAIDKLSEMIQIRAKRILAIYQEKKKQQEQRETHSR
jgi:hypothetical protein